MINILFEKLDEWRKLPSYQLERRADIFFAIHLPLIFKNKFDETIIDIVPELPIRIGTIEEKIPINKSYKIDYAVFTDSQKVYLVELKTDNSSIREKQLNYYMKTINAGFVKIMTGIVDIYNATTYKKKYNNLMTKLVNNGSLIVQNDTFISSTKYNFYREPLFIKPNKLGKDKGYILSFSDIINILENEENVLTKRFTKSLKEWTNDI